MNKIEWIEKYMTKAARLIEEDQVDEGLSILNELLYDEPGYGGLHNMIGWAYYYYTDEVARAELHFKMAIHFEPAYAPPYWHLGSLYQRDAKYHEAIRYLKAGIVHPQANRVAFTRSLAEVYELQGEFAQAIKTLKDALMATAVEREASAFITSLKRCRRKRIEQFFTRPNRRHIKVDNRGQ